MTRFTHALLAAAACTTLSTAALAQTNAPVSDGPDRQGSTLDQTARENQRTGGNAMAASSASGNMAGDQQLIQALQKIGQDPSTAGDKMFVLQAAMADMMEIEGAKLALKKAQSSEVKEVAQQLQTEHGQSLQQLQTLAQKHGLTLPTSLPAHVQQKMAIKASLPTEKFEKAYLAGQQVAHAEAVTMFAVHQDMVQDAGVKQYITQSLPKLKAHTAHIVQASKKMGLPDAIGMTASASHAGH